MGGGGGGGGTGSKTILPKQKQTRISKIFLAGPVNPLALLVDCLTTVLFKCCIVRLSKN